MYTFEVSIKSPFGFKFLGPTSYVLIITKESSLVLSHSMIAKDTINFVGFILIVLKRKKDIETLAKKTVD